MYWHKIAAAVAAAAAAFQEAGVLPASWRQRFPDARLKIHLRFKVVRNLWAILVMFHGRLSRFATQIIEVFFFFAQWWTVIHNSRLVRIRKRHSELFNDGTCTGGWLWIHSRNFSLMTTVNHFKMIVPIWIFCPHSCFIDLLWKFVYSSFIWAWWFPHLRLLLYSYFWMWRRSINATKWTFLTSWFFCAFFMTSFHTFSIVAFASGINIAWVERSFICASRFPEACVSERQISRIFWTVRNSRFLKSSLNRTTFGVHTSLFPCSHWKYLVLPDFEVYLKNFVSQIRCAARRDNMCLLSPSETVRWRAFFRSFHRNEFLRKVVMEYRIPSFPCNTNIIEFAVLPQMFWLFSDPLPASYISSQRSFVQFGTLVELLGSIWWP